MAPQSLDDELYTRGLELLATVTPALFASHSQCDILHITCRTARQLTGADGATTVLRDADQCFYAEEDAIEPLWKGQRFPMSACISGWAMLNARPVMIEDIYGDARVPAEAYRPTFVKSLLIVPIRNALPIGAIGNYWAEHRMPSDSEVELLKRLADCAAVALEKLRAYESLDARARAHASALEAGRQVETQLRRELADARRVSAAVAEPQPAGLQPLTLAALSRLSGHFVRDFSEVLADVVLFGNMIADSLPVHDRLRVEAAALLRASARGVGLIKQLLPFSRSQTLRPGWTQINALVAGMRPALERLIGTTIQLELGLATDLPSAFVDPEQLEDVILNLAVNAQEAMPSGGNLRIDTQVVQVSALDHASLDLEAAGYVTVTIRDTGAGIPHPLRTRIFEPFFTTKAVGETRRGLGLAIVHGIVKQSGGEITVESQPGQGTTFTVYLPCQPPQSA